MDSVDDGRDFNKARGFLLTYSALVLALWYFGADLTQFKLMGNEVHLHQRTNSVWLVLAGLNVYFWFRFYQRLPVDGLYFDSEMYKLYDAALQRLAMRLGREKLKQLLVEHVGPRVLSPADVEIKAYSSQIDERPARASRLASIAKGALKSRFSLSKYQVKVRLIADYKFRIDGYWTDSSVNHQYMRSLSAYRTWPLKAFIIAKGALTTPWFTDHIMPLLLGAISTGFALWKWCEMNFFAATLPHVTQLCAGITH